MNNFLVTAISQLTNGTFDSFINVTIASTILGKNVKASKAIFLEKGEQNGVSKATLNDVWGLAGFFANPEFVRYADVKNAPVSVVTLRLERLGLTKLQHCKEYRALCNDKENLLFNLQTLNSVVEKSDVTDAIANVEGLKAFVTPIGEWQIAAVETKNLLHGYEKLAAEKLAAEKLAAEKLAAEKLAAEKLAAEKLAAEKLAASDEDEADEDEADEDEADEDEADEDEADEDEADEDEADEADEDAPIDTEQMDMLLASVSLLTFAQCEKLEKTLELRFEALRLQKAA